MCKLKELLLIITVDGKVLNMTGLYHTYQKLLFFPMKNQPEVIMNKLTKISFYAGL